MRITQPARLVIQPARLRDPTRTPRYPTRTPRYPTRASSLRAPYQWLSFTKPIRNSDLAQPVPTSCVTNDSDVKLAVDAELPGLCVEQAAQSPVRLSTTCCDR